MKIIIIHPDAVVRSRLVEWLEQTRGHAVLWTGDWPANFRATVAEHEPDMVLLPPPAKSAAHLPEAFATLAFQDCLFKNVPAGALFAKAGVSGTLEALLTEQEENYRAKQWSSRNYADDQRIIIHDEKYQRFASAEKLHVPTREPNWESIAINQESRFVLQLQTARLDDRHQRAQNYFHALQQFDQGLTQEAAYRLAHCSYKIVWLREQIARWLTVLAHYIPDVEIEHCPAPQNASSRIDYLHYQMPPVFNYAVFSVLAHGMNAAVAEQIQDAVSWQFEGQSERQLVATGCMLFGLNTYLAQVARAQVEAMSQFLDPESSFHHPDMGTRSLRRTLGIYFEFWGWNYLWNMGDNLCEITRRFHSGQTRVERPAGSAMTPTFRQFRQLLTATPPLNS